MKCFKPKYTWSSNISVFLSFIHFSFPSTTISRTSGYFLLLAFPLRRGIRGLRGQGLAAFRLPTNRCLHNAIYKPQQKSQQPELRATEKQAKENTIYYGTFNIYYAVAQLSNKLATGNVRVENQ